jgi:hypothetical protein
MPLNCPLGFAGAETSNIKALLFAAALQKITEVEIKK